ncbi:MAG: hypothetical protein R2932_48560 [Caldilineaceae bacterium]
MTDLILEYNGSDEVVLTHDALRTEGSLLTIARELAAAKEADLSEITLRFAENVR